MRQRRLKSGWGQAGSRASGFSPQRASGELGPGGRCSNHSPSKGAFISIAKQTTATVIPALQYQDAPAAIDFLCKAFGFEKKAVYQGEGGSITHAELTLGNGMVMLGSVKETDYGKLLVRPHQVGGVTMSTYCIVADPDAHFARAKAVGSQITRAPERQDYGRRAYTRPDPEG